MLPLVRSGDSLGFMDIQRLLYAIAHGNSYEDLKVLIFLTIFHGFWVEILIRLGLTMRNWGARLRNPSQMFSFRETLEECVLQDIHTTWEFFTWVNKTKDEPTIFECLDHFVGNFK